MSKKKTRIIALAVAAGIIVCGFTAFAKQASETITVMYDNIKIIIDGIEYVAKDANGNVVEPFIYNGTTYLPVRGIANAFNKDVSWDAQTSTVTLGTKNYDWLDQLGYANYDTSGNSNMITAWETGRKATDNIQYDRGMKFWLGYHENNGAKKNNDESMQSYQNVEYLLNSNYKSFEGKMACAEEGSNYQNAIIKVYGDGSLLYTSPPLTKGAKPVSFNIDVSNYKILKINASVTNVTRDSYEGSMVGIVDARLAKK